MTEAGIIDFIGVERRRVYVYELPERLTDGYCFGGGRPIRFQNVDWFDVPVNEPRDILVGFVKRKQYFRADRRFLVLGDRPELTFTIDPERPDAEASYG